MLSRQATCAMDSSRIRTAWLAASALSVGSDTANARVQRWNGVIAGWNPECSSAVLILNQKPTVRQYFSANGNCPLNLLSHFSPRSPQFPVFPVLFPVCSQSVPSCIYLETNDVPSVPSLFARAHRDCATLVLKVFQLTGNSGNTGNQLSKSTTCGVPSRVGYWEQFFLILKELLSDAVQLGLTKLSDPSEGAELTLSNADQPLHHHNESFSDLEEKASAFKLACEKIKMRRNKL